MGLPRSSRFFHFDFVSQCLSKLARGHDRDSDDVRAMLDLRLVSADELISGIEQIKQDLLKFQGVAALAFEQRVRDFVEKSGD